MKVRIISAIVVAAIAIPLALIGGWPFIILVALLSLMAFKELMDLKESHRPYPTLIVIMGIILLLSLIFTNFKSKNLLLSFPFQRLLLFSLIILLSSVFWNKNKYDTNDALYLIGITFLIGISFNLLIVLRLSSLYDFIYVVAIPILTDIFAYFGGTLLGKHKMCEKLSPSKTWEGAFIGLIFGTVGGILIYTFLIGKLSLGLVVFTAFLSIVGQLGDLFFSKIKRENKIKDFSNLIPGHGGILDRMDSVIFVVIAYFALLFLI